MSHIVPSSHFSLLFVNVTNISAVTLNHWPGSLSYSNSASCLYLYYPYDFNIGEVCFFLTIPVAEILVHISGWLLWYFNLDFCHPHFFFLSCVSKEAPEAVLFSYISVTISTNNFSLISWKWGNTVYKAQISLLTLICFQSIPLVIPAALVSWVVSFIFSATFYIIGSIVRIISSFRPTFPFLFLQTLLYKPTPFWFHQ